MGCSILMTICLLAAGVFEKIFGSKDKVMYEFEMDLKKELDKVYTKFELTRILQASLGLHFNVDVWYMRDLGDHCECYVIVEQSAEDHYTLEELKKRLKAAVSRD